MTKSRYIPLAIAAGLLPALSGCEQELDLDKYRNPEVEKMLVVNSILNPDSLIGISVTHPYFFSDAHLLFSPATSLDVEITSPEGGSETLTYDPDSKLYLSRRKPKAGEVLSVRAAGDSETAIACDTIPRKVDIEKIEVSAEDPMHIYWDTDYLFTYKITFQDTPGEENFYFLAVEEEFTPGEFSMMGTMDYTADYVFQVLASQINQGIQGWQPDGVFGYPFSDKGIDGKLYTLTVNEVLQTPFTDMIERLPRKVNLYSISRAYYEYMVSVLAMDYDESALKGNLLSLGLIEPEKIYSNIQGGTGIMGCYNLTSRRIDLLQLTGGWSSQKH